MATTVTSQAATDPSTQPVGQPKTTSAWAGELAQVMPKGATLNIYMTGALSGADIEPAWRSPRQERARNPPKYQNLMMIPQHFQSHSLLGHQQSTVHGKGFMQGQPTTFPPSMPTSSSTAHGVAGYLHGDHQVNSAQGSDQQPKFQNLMLVQQHLES
jgi:hypothetical protein